MLTVLLAPIDAFGHVLPAVGIGQSLSSAGHRVIFAIDESWSGRLTKYGFQEELYRDPERSPDDNRSQQFIKLIAGCGFLTSATPLEKIIKRGGMFAEHYTRRAKMIDPQLGEIIERVNPDIVLVDHMVALPSVVTGNRPWVVMVPSNPLFAVDHPDAPPGQSGLPSNDSSEWSTFRRVFFKQMSTEWSSLNSWLHSFDLPTLPTHKLSYDSPYLNIYQFPAALDYFTSGQLGPKWHRFDSFVRTEPDSNQFEIPDKLKHLPGKLIYFSLGTMGSSQLPLITRLISFLSASRHRFIVAKGLRGDEFDLPENCWGENLVPQTRILPQVDAVMIHGGNNSLCEAFVFGKPMIVMPLFADQYDNAQRVQELGFGIRLDPYECGQDEVLKAIERVVSDQEMAEKMEKAATGKKLGEQRKKLIALFEALV